MSLEIYRILHVLGLILVMMSFGGMIVHVINGGTKESNKWRKATMMTHGIGLLLLLVAGFGMLARLGIHSFPLWVAVKVLVWLAFGGLVAVVYKKPSLATRMWLVVPALALIAAICGIIKPG